MDILVNNAGRSQRAKWENIELSVDKELFDLNVFSTIALSRLVAKYFFQMNEGHFVINSSIAGVTAVPFSATYCASKSSLHVNILISNDININSLIVKNIYYFYIF